MCPLPRSSHSLCGGGDNDDDVDDGDDDDDGDGDDVDIVSVEVVGKKGKLAKRRRIKAVLEGVKRDRGGNSRYSYSAQL